MVRAVVGTMSILTVAFSGCGDIYRTGDAFGRDASALCTDLQDKLEFERALTVPALLRNLDRLRDAGRRFARDLRALELPDDDTRETARRVVDRVSSAIEHQVIPGIAELERAARAREFDRLQQLIVDFRQDLRSADDIYMGDLVIDC